jgi:uncharacterized protein YecA (UPF0149 family)
MTKSEIYYLIENNSQVCLVFETLRQLKEFAKQHKWKIKKSNADFNGVTYYTESYEILPTDEID